MYLREKVENYLNNYNLIADSNGNLLSTQRVKIEYKNIKFFLLDTCDSDDIIGIYLDQDYKYVLTMLACIELGLTYVPLNINWPRIRINKIIKLANIKIVVSNLIEDIEIGRKYIIYDDIIKMKIHDISKIFSIDKQKPLYIIFTSGSTGEPKGVVISRGAYSNFVSWIDSYFTNINRNDNILSVADFTFDQSQMDIGFLLSKHVGFYISRVENNIFVLMRDLNRFSISLISTVPNNFSLMISSPMLKKVNLTTLKTIILGGARFSYGTYIKIIDKFKDSEIYNIYGPTEVTVYCFIKKLTKIIEKDVENHIVSIGSPITKSDGKIYENGINVDINKKGELFISGSQLMNEYLNDIERTNEVLRSINNKKYYKSGDFAYKNNNGEYFIIGRLDDTIKTAGYRVNLSDIDSYIQRIEDISECATIAIKDELKENILVSYVILNNSNYNKHDVYMELLKILPKYQVPEYIEIVNSFPLNNSGKICKKSLKNKFLKEKNENINDR